MMTTFRKLLIGLPAMAALCGIAWGILQYGLLPRGQENTVIQIDTAVCDTMNGAVESAQCYMQVAEKSANVAPCAKIGSPALKQNCASLVAAAKDDIAYCADILSDLTKSDCYFMAARKQSNPEYCNKITNAEAVKNGCLSLVAESTSDVRVCDEILDLHARFLCSFLLAKRMGSTDPCQTITDPVLQKECLTTVAPLVTPDPGSPDPTDSSPSSSSPEDPASSAASEEESSVVIEYNANASTYLNPQDGFSVILPPGAARATSNIGIDRYDFRFDTQTNLQEKYLAIGMQEPSGTCADPAIHGQGTSQVVTISARSFLKEVLNDTNNGLLRTSYSTDVSVGCVTLSLLLHTVTEDPPLPAYDLQKESAFMDSILASFRLEP